MLLAHKCFCVFGTWGNYLVYLIMYLGFMVPIIVSECGWVVDWCLYSCVLVFGTWESEFSLLDGVFGTWGDDFFIIFLECGWLVGWCFWHSWLSIQFTANQIVTAPLAR